jgi:GR25 family glycosyltransferase involved in LPS biosynthesis
MIFRVLLLSLLSFGLQAKVEDHFKKALGKTDFHSMRNIDFIYVINLDQRPEKFARCAKQLALWGINPYRFSAVNGWELSLEVVNDVGIKLDPSMTRTQWGTYYVPGGNREPQHEPVQEIGRTYFSHCMSLGAIGINLSHLSILQDAYDSGYETIWVMEDDIDIMRNPHLLSDMIDKLNQLVGRDGWDILFTDPDTKNGFGQYVPCTGFAWRPNFQVSNPNRFAARQDISSEFRQVGARFGAYSMILQRSGMKKILDFLKTCHIFLPYDIEFPYPEDIRLFTVLFDIVSTTPGAPSDNGAPNYKKDEKKQ